MVKLHLVVLMTIALLISGMGLAFAGHPDSGPGCGLGKIAWENYPNPQHIGPQVLMATTNATGYNTFAISSGTSGCTNDGVVFSSEKANVFAALNFDNLAQEMAQGQGEHLTSLATLMEVPADQQETFFSLTQEKFTSLIKTGENSPKAVIKAIYDAMGAHPVLAKATAAR